MAKERKAFLEQEISILEGALLNKEKLIAEVGDVFEQFDQNKVYTRLRCILYILFRMVFWNQMK